MHDVAKPQAMEADKKTRRKIVRRAIYAVAALFLFLVGIKALQVVTMVLALGWEDE